MLPLRTWQMRSLLLTWQMHSLLLMPGADVLRAWRACSCC